MGRLAGRGATEAGAAEGGAQEAGEGAKARGAAYLLELSVELVAVVHHLALALGVSLLDAL